MSLKGTLQNLTAETPSAELQFLPVVYNLANLKKVMQLPIQPFGTLAFSGKVFGPIKPMPNFDLLIAMVLSETSKLEVKAVKKSPKIVINVNSKNIDVSAYVPKIDVEKSLKSDSKNTDKTKQDSQNSTDVKTSDQISSNAAVSTTVDADVEFLKSEDLASYKKMLQDFPIDLTVDMKQIIANQVTIKDMFIKLDADASKVDVSKVSLKLMDAKIDSAVNVILDVQKPVITGNANLQKLEFKTVVNTFMPSFKDAVSGTFSANTIFNLAGRTKNSFMETLNANGAFGLNDFVCDTASLNDLLKPHLEKIPMVKDKIKLSGKRGWSKVDGEFAIKNKVAELKKFVAEDGDYKAEGKGTINFDMNSNLTLDFSVPYSNIPYEALKINDKQSMIPVHLTGLITKPNIDYAYTAEYIAKKALKFEGDKLKAKFMPVIEQKKQEIKQQVNKEAEEAKRKAEEQAKQELKKAGESLKNKIKGFKF